MLHPVSLTTPAQEKPENLYDDASATEKPAKRGVHFQDDESESPEKPPQTTSPHEQAEITLIEAFPTIDTKVVKAVLTASGGQMEPAFNALLSTGYTQSHLIRLP